MRVGVVSDNHGLIDPALPALLSGAARIVHAGDLVTREILPFLEAIAPVEVVRGNNDPARTFGDLPLQKRLDLDGVRVLVRHIVGKPGRVDPAARREIATDQPRIVIAGHSHRPLAEEAGGVVYLNPGSCGPRRFSLPRTAAVLELARGTFRFFVTDLDDGGVVLDRTFAR